MSLFLKYMYALHLPPVYISGVRLNTYIHRHELVSRNIMRSYLSTYYTKGSPSVILGTTLVLNLGKFNIVFVIVVGLASLISTHPKSRREKKREIARGRHGHIINTYTCCGRIYRTHDCLVVVPLMHK